MPFQPVDVPGTPGYEVFPARLLHQGETVGGDEIFEEVGRDDGRHLFLIVDVCGHGKPGALIVGELRDQYLPQSLCQNNQPAVLLKCLNELLQNEVFTSGLFVVALAVLMDDAEVHVDRGERGAAGTVDRLTGCRLATLGGARRNVPGRGCPRWRV
jgi:hypothetical protein